MPDIKLLSSLKNIASVAFKEAADIERRRAASLLMALAADILRHEIDGFQIVWKSGTHHVSGQVLKDDRGVGMIHGCLHDREEEDNDEEG